MKCRQGFVSNSSSSSFIVSFPKDIELSNTAIKDYLFGEDEFTYYADSRLTTEAATNIILEEMKKQKANDVKNIRSKCNGWIEGAPDDKNYINKKGKCDYKSWSKALDEYRDKYIENFMERVKEKDVYVFEFSDNDSTIGAILEHGGTFNRVPHERISNH